MCINKIDIWLPSLFAVHVYKKHWSLVPLSECLRTFVCVHTTIVNGIAHSAVGRGRKGNGTDPLIQACGPRSGPTNTGVRFEPALYFGVAVDGVPASYIKAIIHLISFL